MLHVNKLHVGEDDENFLLVWRTIIRLERVNNETIYISSATYIQDFAFWKNIFDPISRNKISCLVSTISRHGDLDKRTPRKLSERNPKETCHID